MRRSEHKKLALRALLAFIALLVMIVSVLFLSSLFLRVNHTTLQTAVRSPIRIVHLSDLHNAQFGKENKMLIQKVALQQPDLIILSGDMLNRDDPNTETVTKLITELAKVAPVFFGYGNHEKSWERSFGVNLRPLLEKAGAVVVDNDYVDLDFNGMALRIGGYMGFYPVPKMTVADQEQEARELAFIEDFENTDRLKLLINHIPTGMVDWHYADRNEVDVVFSGHYHGGVVRIPFLDRGVYAPYVGWFPPFTKGVYYGKKAVCVLSPGLGNEHFIPRFNNPPEIIVVDLVPENAG